MATVYQMTANPAKHIIVNMTAADLASESLYSSAYVSFGHVNGREHFGLDFYYASEDGTLYVTDSNGRAVITHPANRILRVLRGKG